VGPAAEVGVELQLLVVDKGSSGKEQHAAAVAFLQASGSPASIAGLPKLKQAGALVRSASAAHRLLAPLEQLCARLVVRRAVTLLAPLTSAALAARCVFRGAQRSRRHGGRRCDGADAAAHAA